MNLYNLYKHVYTLNKPILDLPESHPARRFLDAFVQCRNDCVGRELDNPPVDQSWHSAIDNQDWSFSGFAYTYLSFDVELDGWLNDSQTLTPAERSVIEGLPRARGLLNECREAAMTAGNDEVLELVDKTTAVLTLWEECILARCGGE